MPLTMPPVQVPKVMQSESTVQPAGAPAGAASGK